MQMTASFSRCLLAVLVAFEDLNCLPFSSNKKSEKGKCKNSTFFDHKNLQHITASRNILWTMHMQIAASFSRCLLAALVTLEDHWRTRTVRHWRLEGLPPRTEKFENSNRRRYCKRQQANGKTKKAVQCSNASTRNSQSNRYRYRK